MHSRQNIDRALYNVDVGQNESQIGHIFQIE
jgi:hypothetical protein